MTLFDRKVWDAALVEFLASRSAFPTRSNTQNAAICLRNLNRFDEALDMFEALVKEFPNLSPTDKSAVEKEIAELQQLVGATDIRSQESGAQITIDGRERGTTPAPPLRVAAGTHVLRVYKDGFAPVEKRVAVAGKETLAVDAKLETLSQSGRLSVTEDGGKGAEVLVDNVGVGRTPWAGLVGPGEHVVFLRGEGSSERSRPTRPCASTRSRRSSSRSRPSTARSASSRRRAALRWPSTASWSATASGTGASARADTRSRSRRPGSSPSSALDLPAAAHERLAVQLERDPDSPLWQAQKKPIIFAELDGSFPLALLVGGDVSGSGSASFPLGVVARAHVGYELPSWLGFGLAAGYLYLARDVDDRQTTLRPVGKAEAPGTANDKLSLKGLLLGGSAQLHRSTFGEKMPLLLRVGVGAFLASATDRRAATARPSTRRRRSPRVPAPTTTSRWPATASARSS